MDAKPDRTTFRREVLGIVLREAMPLMRRHHAALNVVEGAPFDPDFERYFALERAGCLVVFTARNRGELVGYSIWTLSPHAFHASMLAATNETFWLEPEFRQWTTGMELFAYSEQELAKLGASLLFAYGQIEFEKQHGGVTGKLLSRLGFKPMDQLYIKDLRHERATGTISLPVEE